MGTMLFHCAPWSQKELARYKIECDEYSSILFGLKLRAMLILRTHTPPGAFNPSTFWKSSRSQVHRRP